MTIRAVVFDIGGILKITSDLRKTEKWEKLLNLQPGEFNERLREVWMAGSLGKCSDSRRPPRLSVTCRWHWWMLNSSEWDSPILPGESHSLTLHKIAAKSSTK